MAGTLETIGTSFSFLSDEVAIGPSAMVPLLLLCTVAKNCQVYAITYSLLASLVLCILLGVSLILLSGISFK